MPSSQIRAALVFASITSATVVQAQGPRGAGPDALTPPAGAVRISFGGSWSRNTDDYVNGRLQELGARFTMDSVTPSAMHVLAASQSAIRSAAGLPDFTASLGSLSTHARRTFETTPISIEAGITSRISLGVTVPFVTSISRVDVNIAPLGRNATVGLNPATTIAALVTTNGQLLSQLDAAAAFVNGRLATCAASPSAAGCSSVNTNAASARALVDGSTSFGNALAALYGGRTNTTPSLFSPIAGSSAQASIASRLAGFKSQFAAFGAPAITASVPGGTAPVTAADFQSIVADTSLGLITRPLDSETRRGIGNIDVAATVRWHDSYARAASNGPWRDRLWWRSAVVAIGRLGTGNDAEAGALIPIATGSHASSVDLRSITDIGVGPTYSMTAALRYAALGSRTVSVARTSTAGEVFPDGYDPLTLTPGAETQFDVYPRWTPSDAIAIALHYGYRQTADDRYTGPAGTESLGAGTAQHEHRFGAEVTYSTLAGFDRGTTRFPIEVSLSHFQTTNASGADVPKLAYDAVVMRWYWRMRRSTPAAAR